MASWSTDQDLPGGYKDLRGGGEDGNGGGAAFEHSFQGWLWLEFQSCKMSHSFFIFIKMASKFEAAVCDTK